MVSVVLWNVENPGNLGAIARLCANFKVDQLLLIEPRCNPLDQIARNRAKHAQHVLESARIVEPEVLDEFDLVAGTTAQIGSDFNLHRSSVPPTHFSNLASSRGSVALVFGSESHGLSNDQLSYCGVTVHIATNPEYPVLNLSHAVAIMLYALSDGGTSPHEPVGVEELRVLEQFMDDVIDRLDFSSEDKRQTQRQVWRNLFQKSHLTRREAFALLGLLRKLKDKDL